MKKSALLYLPGLDGTGQLLYRQQDLYREFEVLCESYPQHHSVTYDELASTAAGHLADMNSQSERIVLAESFGGAVALLLALEHPELIDRLMLVNTFAYFPARWLIRTMTWLGNYFPDRPSPPATRGLRGKFFMSKEVSNEVRQDWWERTADVPARAFGLRLPLIVDLDLRPRLKEIAIPTLVLAAPDDRVVPPKAGRELARLLPNATLIEPRVGHAALIHPKVNICSLLKDESLWPAQTQS